MGDQNDISRARPYASDDRPRFNEWVRIPLSSGAENATLYNKSRWLTALGVLLVSCTIGFGLGWFIHSKLIRSHTSAPIAKRRPSPATNNSPIHYNGGTGRTYVTVHKPAENQTVLPPGTKPTPVTHIVSRGGDLPDRPKQPVLPGPTR